MVLWFIGYKSHVYENLCLTDYSTMFLREKGGSRNLVGIAIQLSDSEEEKLFVHDSMQVSPE